ncbi:MAG: four helix bundle protein, partial [Bdellovibrionales bacterium]
MVSSFEELDVYQKAYKLALNVHKTSSNFPKSEQYGMASQMKRASKSICANLAEGFAKQHISKPEFKRFIMIALGSCEEMRVWTSF